MPFTQEKIDQIRALYATETYEEKQPPNSTVEAPGTFSRPQANPTVQKPASKDAFSADDLMREEIEIAEKISKESQAFREQEQIRMGKEAEDYTTLKAIGRGYVSGTAQAAGSVATGIQALGGYLNMPTVERFGKQTYEEQREIQKKFAAPEYYQQDVLGKPSLLLDPKWLAYNLFQIVPSAVLAYGTGRVAAGAIMKAPKSIAILGHTFKLTKPVIDRLALLGGNIFGGAVAGGLEGTSTYQEILAKGGTREEAEEAMRKMTLASGTLNAISFNQMYKKMPKGLKKAAIHFITTGLTEGFTEWAEEPFEGFIKKNLGYATTEDIINQTKQGFNVFLPAAIMGVGGAAMSQIPGNEPPGGVPTIMAEDQKRAVINEIKEDIKKGKLDDPTAELAVKTATKLRKLFTDKKINAEQIEASITDATQDDELSAEIIRDELKDILTIEEEVIEEPKKADEPLTDEEIKEIQESAIEAEEPIGEGIVPDTSKRETTGIILDKDLPWHKEDIDNIKTDPETYQFKEGADVEGVTQKLKGEYDPVAAGDFLVHERLDGTLYVVNAHNRLDFAKRSGVKEVNVQVLKESEGWTPEMARRRGADLNIKEGGGTIYDWANYIREDPNYAEEKYQFAKGKIQGKAHTIARKSSDNTYSLFRNEEISPEAAYTIADAADKLAKDESKNRKLQMLGANYAVTRPNAKMTNIAGVMSAASQTEGIDAVQIEMFGADSEWVNVYTRLEDAAESLRAPLKKELSILSRIIVKGKNAQQRIQEATDMGIVVKNPAELRKRQTSNKEKLAKLEAGEWVKYPDIKQEVYDVAGLPLNAAALAIQDDAIKQDEEVGEYPADTGTIAPVEPDLFAEEEITPEDLTGMEEIVPEELGDMEEEITQEDLVDMEEIVPEEKPTDLTGSVAENFSEGLYAGSIAEDGEVDPRKSSHIGAWRSMGQKEYDAFTTGKKIGGEENAGKKGHFFSWFPSYSANLKGKKGKPKYLVEIKGVDVEGETTVNPVGIEDVSAVWRSEGNEWERSELPRKEVPEPLTQEELVGMEEVAPEEPIITEPTPTVLEAEKVPEKPPIKAEEAPAETYELPEETRNFVDSKIKELGSVEKVNGEYNTDSKIDVYAREVAPKILGVKVKEAPQKPSAVEAEEGVKAKEPWEMTKDEFTEYEFPLIIDELKFPQITRVKKLLHDNDVIIDEIGVTGSHALGMATPESDIDIYIKVPENQRDKADTIVSALSKEKIDVLVNWRTGKYGGIIRGDKTHERIIKKALSEGKPVPAEVLKEYPELVKEPSTPAKKEIVAREEVPVAEEPRAARTFQPLEEPATAPKRFAAIEKKVKQIYDKWENSPSIIFVKDEAALPDDPELNAMKAKGKGKIDGVFHNGIIYLISDNIKSPAHVQRILLHEGFHKGVRDAFGKDVEPILKQVYKKYENELDDIVELYDLDINKPEDQLLAAEEKLANIAENPAQARSIWNKFVLFVKRWAIKHGFNIKLTNKDIQTIIAKAHADIKITVTQETRLSRKHPLKVDYTTALVDMFDSRTKEPIKAGEAVYYLVDTKETVKESTYKDMTELGEQQEMFGDNLVIETETEEGMIRPVSSELISKGTIKETKPAGQYSFFDEFDGQTSLFSRRMDDIEPDFLDIVHSKNRIVINDTPIRWIKIPEEKGVIGNYYKVKQIGRADEVISEDVLVSNLRALASGEIDPFGPEYEVTEEIEDLDTIVAKYKKAIADIKEQGYWKPGMKGFEEHREQWFRNRDERAFINSVERKWLRSKLMKILGKKGKAFREGFDQEAQDMEYAIQLYIDMKRRPEHYEYYRDDIPKEDLKIADLSQTIEDNPDLKRLADYVLLSDRMMGIIGTGHGDLLAGMDETIPELKKSVLEDPDYEFAFDKFVGREVPDYPTGVIRNIIDNHVNRIWRIVGAKAPPGETMSKFGPTTRHAKQRTFETIFEGLATKPTTGERYELAVTGAFDNLNILKDNISQALEDKELIQHLKKLKYYDGRPIITTEKFKGYMSIEHPNFITWEYAGKVEKGKVYASDIITTESDSLLQRKKMYAPEEVAKRLNKILGKSRLRGVSAKIGGKEYYPIDVVTKWNAVLKGVRLLTSLFHHQAYLRSYYFGTRHKTRNEWNPVKAYKMGMDAINNLDEEIIFLVKNGLTLGRNQDYLTNIYDIQDSMIANKVDNALGKIPKAKEFKDWLMNNARDFTGFLFNNFGPAYKTQASLIEFRNMLKENPKMDPNEAAKLVADLMNDDFGGLHLQRMERDPTIQHVFRLTTLASDWTESNIRTMYKMFSSDPMKRRLYQRFWGSVISKGIGMTIIGNLLLSLADDDDPTRRLQKAWREGKLRWLDIDITPIHRMLGGRTEARKYFSLIGHFRDPLKFILNMSRSAQHKSSVLAGLFTDFIKATDWRGQAFTDIDELLGIDDKGYYKVTTKKYRKGDPKGGKLRRKLTKYQFGTKGPVSYRQTPSYLLYELQKSLPIQIQNTISFVNGELSAFDAILRSAGLYATSTYAGPQQEKDIIIDDYIHAQDKGNDHALMRIKERVKSFNERHEGEAKIVLSTDARKEKAKRLKEQRALLIQVRN